MRKFFYIFMISLLFFVSCDFQTSKGTLIVSNYSENENLEITNVYVKEKESSGYILVYSGSIPNTQSYFIELVPGNYSVKINVLDKTYGFFEQNTLYETGYNIYENTTLNKAISVIFDGNGVYFE